MIQALGEHPRVLVIFLQPREIVVERVETGGGQESRLPHSAAEALAQAPSAIDLFLGSGETGSDRCPEPFGETDGDRVHVLAPARERYRSRHRGIEQAGTVQVQFQPALAAAVSDLIDALQRNDRAALSIVSVLQTDERCSGLVKIVRRDRILDLSPSGSSSLGGHQARPEARKRGGSARLVVIDVTLRLEDDLIAGTGVKPDSDLIAHRAAGNVESRFLTQLRGDSLLQMVDGGIVSVDVVSDFGFRDGLSHRQIRPRDRVTA